MSSINPNRSSLIIACLESSFELSSLPLGQISIYYEIHLEHDSMQFGNIHWKECRLKKNVHWKHRNEIGKPKVSQKHLFDAGNILRRLVTFLCFRSQTNVSKLQIVFPIQFHCFRITLFVSVECFQFTYFVSKRLCMFPKFILYAA